MVDAKKCNGCGLEKPLDSFYLKWKSGSQRESRCKQCKIAARMKRTARPCRDCGAPCHGKRCQSCHFVSNGWHPKRGTCSEAGCEGMVAQGGVCWKHYDRRRRMVERPCVVCGSLVWSKPDSKRATVCPDSACKKANHRAHLSARRRGMLVRSVGPRVVPEVVFERDNFRCHRCGVRCVRSGGVYSDRYPTLDHLVPLSRGGEHSLVNVACCCRRCNMTKGYLLGGTSCCCLVIKKRLCLLVYYDGSDGGVLVI